MFAPRFDCWSSNFWPSLWHSCSAPKSVREMEVEHSNMLLALLPGTLLLESKSMLESGGLSSMLLLWVEWSGGTSCGSREDCETFYIIGAICAQKIQELAPIPTSALGWAIVDSAHIMQQQAGVSTDVHRLLRCKFQGKTVVQSWPYIHWSIHKGSRMQLLDRKRQIRLQNYQVALFAAKAVVSGNLG